jgi:3-deoxy-D-manno-octulosonate 8-phosphate phosphatase (KDO 8-P phosphatase)
LLEQTGIDEQQVCYAGDDWIDLPVLQRVGLAVTVPDADKIVQDSVHWVTSHNGGKGAVREICNLVLAAQGLDEKVLDEILKQNTGP